MLFSRIVKESWWRKKYTDWLCSKYQ